MNPKQQAFIEAFKAWNAEAMAAVISIVRELLGGLDFTAASKADLGWSCRELLDFAQSHPGIFTSMLSRKGGCLF